VWFDNAWQFRKAITVDSEQVSSSLSDFPMLVSITDAQLGAVVLGNGDDIVFTSSNGITQLSHEIESWNDTPNTLVAWVKIPTLLSSTDTKIYMYYGNPSATNQEDVVGTWNPGYVGVYHLHDDFLDSTNNNNDATNSGTTDFIGEFIADSQSIDGIDDYISLGGGASTTFTTTLQSWVYLEDVSHGGIIETGQWGSSSSSANYAGIVLQVGADGRAITGFGDNSGSGKSTRNTCKTSSGELSLNQWYLLHSIIRGNNDQTIYIDGVNYGALSCSGTATTSVHDGLGYLGTRYVGQHPLDGRIDESRIYQGELTDDWILTEYNNQNDPSSFYLIGIEENQ